MSSTYASPARGASRSRLSAMGHPGSSESIDREEGATHVDQRLAQALGWFSIGLGLTQILAPGELARFIGLHDTEDNRIRMRMFGLRELTSGLGIFSSRRPSGWLWGRVAGDAMDLAALGNAMASGPREPERVAGAVAAVIGVTALDVIAAVRHSQRARREGDGILDVRKAITVKRSPQELYAFWRDFRNLPRFMRHLQSVEVLDDRRSRWTTRGPMGSSISWEAEIVDDQPNRQIAWRSVDGSRVDTSGVVWFVPAPGGRGTEVHVALHYVPPLGVVGATVAKLFGESAEQQIQDDLRIFKQVMETGQITISESSGDGSHLVQRPGRPVEAVGR